MPVLSKPESYDGDWEEDTDYSWDDLARKQLSRDTSWETVEDGDVLALFDRDCIKEDWSRRCFALIAGENAYIFNEQGAPIDDPSNFVTKGRHPPAT